MTPVGSLWMARHTNPTLWPQDVRIRTGEKVLVLGTKKTGSGETEKLLVSTPQGSGWILAVWFENDTCMWRLS